MNRNDTDWEAIAFEVVLIWSWPILLVALPALHLFT
jgi:hypothetical protein